MSTRRKPSNFIVRHLLKPLWRSLNVLAKTLINWVLRSFLVSKRRNRFTQAGFVLPTVIMVILVVTLLTTAILIRSFDRTKNASNYRVDQAVFNAAAPALDRGRAKLDRLLSTEENRLPGTTPDETSIANVLSQPDYTFGDETQLKLVAEFNTTPGLQPEETLQTAWKFPVDTDNNGKFDSFTLYGIYFRNPTTDRARGPLEARGLPQAQGKAGGCESGGGGQESGWYQTDGQLKKAFFTYVATVPIRQAPAEDYNGISTAQFEVYKGNKGFSALETQIDQARISLDNNAVFYNDDLEIGNTPELNLNGRIQTNGNLLVNNGSFPITFYQVSSPYSCFYNPENAKIVVGGNVATGNFSSRDSYNSNSTKRLVTAHAFKEQGVDFAPERQGNFWVLDDNPAQVTTTSKPTEVAYNSTAYAKRLDLLTKGALKLVGNPTNPEPDTLRNTMGSIFPKEIFTEFDNQCKDEDEPSEIICQNPAESLTNVISRYFEARTRRIPYSEIPIENTDADALKAGGTVLDEDSVFTAGNSARPIAAPLTWMQIENPNSGNDVANYTKLPLNINGSQMMLPAKRPSPSDKKEDLIGDRILVGNGLPQQWLKPDQSTYAKPGEEQPILDGATPVQWNTLNGEPNGGSRQRKSRVKPVEDLGDISRNGYWEQAAALSGQPRKESEDTPGGGLAGGLRIITGAGIYVDDVPVNPIEVNGVLTPGGGMGARLAKFPNPRILQANPTYAASVKSFLPNPPTATQVKALNPAVEDQAGQYNTSIVVWPDSMPMFQGDNPIDPSLEPLKGDLQMRATVVYHYAIDSDTDQDPIACISSYYDPTNETTARDITNGGQSNNGFNYNPSGLAARRTSPTLALRKQAYMVFPDGRWANEPLKKAIDKLDGRDTSPLTLSDYAAIDAANCAFQILQNPNARTPNTLVPDGAIREAAFLDARQVKALHKPVLTDPNTGAVTYDPTTNGTKLADITNPDKVKIAEQASDLTTAYSLPIEERQPLEIRVTEINLDPTTGITRRPVPAATQEFMVPNSGIIYASRDDARPDLSDPTGLKPSSTDFKLDPLRRPNGIRLINGKDLSRVSTYRAEEKGFILASDLPVYIKGDFNLHRNGNREIEEFEELVNDRYDNFYTRSGAKNPNFACRQGANADCDEGDSWRAARILSDAITLLSKDFQDGVRQDGDYDLRNNAGNLAVEARLKNGFWWNSYGTNTPGTPVESSYVKNSVTPIQRRASFRAYQMEICPKLPVSECRPEDWILDPARAGTTVYDPNIPAAADRNYPRRVAFERDPDTDQLVLDSTTGYARPIAADGTVLTYGSSPTLAPPVDNALWFWTTTDNTKPYDTTLPNDPSTFSYSNNNLLYSLPPEPEIPAVTGETVNERQLLLPGTPKFPESLSAIPAFAGNTFLNGQTAIDPSDYAVCIRVAGPTLGAGSSIYSKQFNLQLDPPDPNECTFDTGLGRAYNMRVALLNLAAGDDVAVNPAAEVDPPPPNALAVKSQPVGRLFKDVVLTATKKVNVYEVPDTGILGDGGPLNLVLDRGNQSDPIFVFRTNPPLASNPLRTPPSQEIKFGNPATPGGVVRVTLKGVTANNVFWVADRGVAITDEPHQLVGNFIGGGFLTLGTPDRRGNPGPFTQAQLKAVRFLGFLVRTAPVFPPTSKAMTTTDEPLLVPVLQLHSPSGTPSTDLGTAFGRDRLNNTWLQRATAKTTFNAVLIMGDSPSRPIPGASENEYGGGLPNFPRFLEAWEEREDAVAVNPLPAKISGGLIQFFRSKYASAPFEAISDRTKDTSLFFDASTGGKPDYMQTVRDEGFVYRGGASGRKAPYYRPAKRQWGYDIGLLSQTPDLFSRRFASPSAGTPNEYYREVGQDDKWVQALLCAGEPNAGGTFQYSLDAANRPPNCRPIGEYN